MLSPFKKQKGVTEQTKKLDLNKDIKLELKAESRAVVAVKKRLLETKRKSMSYLKNKRNVKEQTRSHESLKTSKAKQTLEL